MVFSGWCEWVVFSGLCSVGGVSGCCLVVGVLPADRQWFLQLMSVELIQLETAGRTL